MATCDILKKRSLRIYVKIKSMKEKFSVSGMSCVACSTGIEKNVKKLKGVSVVNVSLMGESMLVEYDEALTTRQEIMDTVLGLGYGIDSYQENVLQARKPQPNLLKKRFLISLIFLLPLMYLSMGGMIGLPQPHEIISITLQMFLAVCIIVINFKFFSNGTKALIKKSPNMDTLVALGSGVSFL